MRIAFTFGADLRDGQGKGASRRLRHKGKVPAILYGGHQDAQSIVLDQQNLLTMVGNEKFYSSIVQLKIGDKTQEAIVKDIQMHPAKNVVVHVDLQRVVENEKIRIMLPIHFKNETSSRCRAEWSRTCARTWKSFVCPRICPSSSSWTWST
jgi:large subunit ribosomal protein L25